MSELEEPLSEREIEILRLVATGVSNKEIALSLNISPNTVKVHLRNIFNKIGVVSRTEATVYAIKNRLTTTSVPEPVATQAADEIIFSASPIAIATEIKEVATQTTRSPFTSWVVVLLITAAILIGLTVSAWILATRGVSLPGVNNTPTTTPLLRWTLKDPLPSARFASSSVSYGNKIYLVGGRDTETTFSDLLQYESKKSGWLNLAPKPTPVSDTQAVVIQEKIFIPGGRLANGSPTATLEVYDIQSDRWETYPPMPAALIGSGVAAVEGELYVIGGEDEYGLSKKIYRFDSNTKKWSQPAELPTARSYSAITVIEGHIQILGGMTEKGPTAEVLNYFPTRNASEDSAFEIGTPLPKPRSHANAVYLANITYIFGGIDADHNPQPGWAYIQGQSEWTILDPGLESVGESITALALGNFIHLIGGSNQNEASATHQVYQAIYTISLPVTTN